MAISGERFKSARNAAGMTQQQAADALGVGLRTIGYWERPGGRVPAKSEERVMDLLPRLGLLNDNEVFARFAPGGDMEEFAQELLENPLTDAATRERTKQLLQAASRHKPEIEIDIKDILLGMFSDADLLEELLGRAMERGNSIADWSAERVAGSAPRMKEVLSRLHKAENRLVHKADPDYSGLSKADHGLAAYEGDKDIAFDADPED